MTSLPSHFSFGQFRQPLKRFISVASVAISFSASSADSRSKVDFNRQVRPILSENC